MPPRRFAAIIAVIVGLVAGVAGVAAAQSVSNAVKDLRQYDVTYEDGAPGLTPSELNRLDSITAGLQQPGAFYKVVVLAEPVTDYRTPREFADVVLTQLGGTGRVQVFDTNRVGIASNVPSDTDNKISEAETSAASAANSGQSYAAGVTSAADILGIQSSGSGGGNGSGSGSGSSSGSSSGGSSAIWIVLIVALLAVGGFVLWRMFKKSKRATESPVSLGEGEMKVRQSVDTAGNLVLELADRVEQPGAPPEAKQLFQAGAATFAGLQDDLEAADTRPELEAVYPQITDAVYKLQSSKALLDGTPAPPAPSNEPLFPAPVAPAPVAPGPGAGAPMAPSQPAQGYQGFSSSPWLTTAATAALTMLATRSMAPQRSYRPPADDGMFFGGGGGRGGGRGSGRRGGGGGGSINLSGGSGSGGRGMGRRR